jgi:hypothetical protein
MLPCTQTPVSHVHALKLLNGKAKEEKKETKKINVNSRGLR